MVSQIILNVALGAFVIVELIIIGKDIKAIAEEMGGSKATWQRNTTLTQKG